MGMNIKSRSGASIESNIVSPIKAETIIDIKVLHGILGHASEAVVRKKEKYYGCELLGTFKTCEYFHLPRLNVRTCQRVVVLKLLYLVNIYALT